MHTSALHHKAPQSAERQHLRGRLGAQSPQKPASWMDRRRMRVHCFHRKLQQELAAFLHMVPAQAHVNSGQFSLGYQKEPATSWRAPIRIHRHSGGKDMQIWDSGQVLSFWSVSWRDRLALDSLIAVHPPCWLRGRSPILAFSHDLLCKDNTSWKPPCLYMPGHA